MTITLAQWREAEARIDAYQVPDAPCLLDRLPADWLGGLTDLECLALQHDPRAYLRARQYIPPDGDELVVALIPGRGYGKSHAAAGWVCERVQDGPQDRRADYALVAPSEDDVWKLQWEAVKALLPPWVRYVECKGDKMVVFPDHNTRLLVHSAYTHEYRGPNLRGAWCEEPTKWSNGEKLWRTLEKAIRVPGQHPPRAVITTTPPRELGWILELCADPGTRVVRGTMRDNPALDQRAVDAQYRKYAGTIEGQRELDGRCVFGADGALFRLDDLERNRVDAAPKFEEVVVSVDPAQSASSDADPVGIAVVGFARGHVYVSRSCAERLEPAQWAQRAIRWADEAQVGRYVVEPTGSGKYPRDTLNAHMQIARVTQRPIVESKAQGSKADRAQPLSLASAQGRLHIVGHQPDLERELTTWYPGCRWSPNGLDAVVHGASVVTNRWRNL